MKRRNLMIGGAAVLAAGGGFVWLRGGGADLPPELVGAANAQEAAGTVPDMVLGDPNAPVTVVEYASFTCPHCGNFHRTTFDRVKTDYIDTGKVRFVYREVYFDRFALWAAMVARCGGDMKYFGIVDMIYDSQAEWIGDGDEAAIAENLRKLGLKAGIGQEQLEACLNDNAKAEAMVATFQKNATEDAIESTPTFIINGEKHSGDMPYEEFAALLDAQLGG